MKFLRSQGILRNGKLCNQCDLWMKHVTCSEAGDGYFWGCPNCKRKASVREGSFFEKQRLNLSVLLKILYFFLSGTSPTDAIKCLKVQHISIEFMTGITSTVILCPEPSLKAVFG